MGAAQEAAQQLQHDKEILAADLDDAKRGLRQQHDRCSKLEVSLSPVPLPPTCTRVEQCTRLQCTC